MNYPHYPTITWSSEPSHQDLHCLPSWVYLVWLHILSFLLLLIQERAVVSYWRKYVHEVLVNRLGGLSLPRKSVVRLTDSPGMTLDVYHGCKTTQHSYVVVVVDLLFYVHSKHLRSCWDGTLYEFLI